MKVEIEGTYGEGGGQILRTAIALSAVTGMPVRVINVRGKRSPHGLRPQHKTAVDTLARYVDADVKGAEIGSSEVDFSPKNSRLEHIVADIGTAGSSTLILQSLLPVMLFSRNTTEIEIRGGTNNPLAPPFDYLDRVLLPTLAKMGAKTDLRLKRRGFYPKGGGVLAIRTEPSAVLNSINLTEFGEVRRISGIAFSSRLPGHIVPRMANAAQSRLEKVGCRPQRIGQEILQEDDPRCAFSPGCGIVLTAILSSGAILGSDELGRIGKSAEQVSRAAADALIHMITQGVPTDEHLVDQLLVYMALAKGRSMVRAERLTMHMISCIYVCEQFLGRIFSISKGADLVATVTCDGVGFSVP
jgi:RNA 3'-terminal phosphate cyclase (ATP)